MTKPIDKPSVFFCAFSKYIPYYPANSPGLFDIYFFKISAYFRGRLIPEVGLFQIFFYKISTYYRDRHHNLGFSLHKHDFISNFFKNFPQISAYFRGRLIPGVGLFDFIFPEISAYLRGRLILGVGLFAGQYSI